MASPEKSSTPNSQLTRWTGWDPRRREGTQAVEIDQERTSHSTDKGTTENYALLAVVARGFRPPQFLQRHNLSETEANNSDEDTTPEIIPGVGDIRLTWSVRYRWISTTRPEATAKPYAIYLLGVNPPPDASTEDLEVFNDFYTNVHLPEVAERRNAIRAERFELVDEQRPPYQGAPRFLATYEVDEAGAANRRHVGPPYKKGPEIWQQHKTPWRLWYRRLTNES